MLVAIIDKIFLVYMLMLFVRILGSWFPEYQAHPFMRFVAFYTDPYLNFFRGVIPPLGMIDISPIIGFFCLGIIEQILKALVA
jgi:YggT family protein